MKKKMMVFVLTVMLVPTFLVNSSQIQVDEISGLNQHSGILSAELSGPDREIANTMSWVRENSHQKVAKSIREVNYAELVTNSSQSNLEVTKISETTHLKEGISTTDYILNFTHIREYSTQADQEGKVLGFISYKLEESFNMKAYSYFPVVLRVTSTSSVKAGTWTNVETQAFLNPEYTAAIGFTTTAGLSFEFQQDIPFIGDHYGPENLSHTYAKKWEFPTPLNGMFLGAKQEVTVPIPPNIPILRSLGIGVQPKIDADFSANLRSNKNEVVLTNTELDWVEDGSIQSFSFQVPEFTPSEDILLELFDFNMDFSLALDFSLEADIDLWVTSFDLSLRVYTWELGLIDLPLQGTLPLSFDVNPTEALPDILGLGYEWTDNDDDQLQPGDSVNLTVFYTNIGRAAAHNLSIDVVSENVTTSGSDSIDYLGPEKFDFRSSTNFGFTVPLDYPAFTIWTQIIFTSISPNGTEVTSSYPIPFRVEHPSYAFVQATDDFLIYSQGDVWWSGSQVDLAFRVSNDGDQDVSFTNLNLVSISDTDDSYPVSVVTDVSNDTSLLVGTTAILGNLTLTADPLHDDGFVTLNIILYYEDSNYYYQDLIRYTLVVVKQRPILDLAGAMGQDEDLDGVFEAGERVNIFFNLTNSGYGTVSDLEGQLVADSPDLNFTTTNVWFLDLPAGEYQESSIAVVELSEHAMNQTAEFSLYVTGTDERGNPIQAVFGLLIEVVEIPVPTIELVSYSIDDSVHGNGDGQVDPGEVFLLYINVATEGRAVGVVGNVSCTQNIYIHNTTSSYGDLNTGTSEGEGFIVGIPLGYDGSEVRVEITVAGESLAGRSILKSAYLILDVPLGDITNPDLTLRSNLPATVVVDTTLILEVLVEDPPGSEGLTSGVEDVYFFWAYENETIQIQKLNSTNSTFEAELTLEKEGNYFFAFLAIDQAGNYAILADGEEAFLVEVYSGQTTTMGEHTTTSTTTTTASNTSENTMISSTDSNTETKTTADVKTSTSVNLLAAIGGFLWCSSMLIISRKKKREK